MLYKRNHNALAYLRVQETIVSKIVRFFHIEIQSRRFIE